MSLGHSHIWYGDSSPLYKYINKLGLAFWLTFGTLATPYQLPLLCTTTKLATPVRNWTRQSGNRAFSQDDTICRYNRQTSRRSTREHETTRTTTTKVTFILFLTLFPNVFLNNKMQVLWSFVERHFPKTKLRLNNDIDVKTSSLSFSNFSEFFPKTRLRGVSPTCKF